MRSTAWRERITDLPPRVPRRFSRSILLRIDKRLFATGTLPKPRNALGRAVFFNRLGEMHRSFENQRYRASGLNLVTAAIVLRNTVYLERPIQVIKERGQPVDENLLQHVLPLAWEHINLTGDYVWRQTRRVEKGKLRPLRPFPRA
jgi:hypothetical protein